MQRGGRAIADTLRLAQGLQATGLQWMKTVRTKEQVAQAMHYYMTRLGIDVADIPPVIHIAGTKGKGSTAAMCESILRHQGLRTGLFTSPHLVRVTERFKIDGESIPEQEYLRTFWDSWDAITTADPPAGSEAVRAAFPPSGQPIAATGCAPAPGLPGFNLFLLLAFRVFIAARVDVLVLEVGVGGRLDPTNILATPAVCGIMALDFDHCELLGHTLPAIAREKAGILKPGIPAVTAPHPPPVMDAIAEEAWRVGAPLFVADAASLHARCPGGAPPPLGIDAGMGFQQTNAAVAVALAEVFMHQRTRAEAEMVALQARSAAEKGVPPLASAPVAIGRPSSALETAQPPPRQMQSLCSIPSMARDLQLRASGQRAASRPPAIDTTLFRGHGACAFGSTASPDALLPRADAHAARPTYSRSEPVAAATLLGLRHTFWPGRAQVVDVPVSALSTPSPLTTSHHFERSPNVSSRPPCRRCTPETTTDATAAGVSGSSPPGVRVYLDGAHTQQSMAGAVQWWNRRTGLLANAHVAGASGGRARTPRCLVFNCGTGKDVLQLLLPLSTATFDRVYFTHTPWMLTAGAPKLTADDALSIFLSRTEVTQGPAAAAGLRAAMAATGTHSTPSTPTGTAAADVDTLPWQHTLAGIYQSLFRRPEFLGLRRAIAAQCGSAADELAVEPPHCSVLPSFADVLQDLQGVVDGDAHPGTDSPAAHVLVTGSLYLVGSALEELERRGADVGL